MPNRPFFYGCLFLGATLFSPHPSPLFSQSRWIDLGPSTQRAPQQEWQDYEEICSLWKRGEPAQAQQKIQQFFHRFPRSLFSERLVALRGKISCAQKQFERAREDFAALTDEGLREATLSAHCQTLVELGNTDELLQLTAPFAKKFKSDPSHPSFLVGWTYFCQGQLEQALQRKERKQLLSLFKDFSLLKGSAFHTLALSSQGRILSFLGKVDDACALYEELRATDPLHSQKWTYLQAQLEKKHAPEKAQALFELAIEQGGPLRAQGWHQLATLLCERGEHATLLSHLPKLKEQLSPDQFAHLSLPLALAAYGCGHKLQAERFFQQFLSCPPPSHPLPEKALSLQALLARENQDLPLLTHTREKLTELYGIHKGGQAALLEIALALEEEKLDHAQELFSLFSSSPLSPSQDKKRQALQALLHEKRGQWEEALHLWEELLRQAPSSFPSAQRHWLHCCHQSLLTAPCSLEKMEEWTQLLLSLDPSPTSLSPLWELITTLYEKRAFSSCLSLSQHAFQLSPPPSLLPHLHGITSCCFYELQGESPSFLTHGEQALALSSAPLPYPLLYLALARFHLQQENSPPQSHSFHIERAEQLLSTLFSLDPHALPNESVEWLAQRLFLALQEPPPHRDSLSPTQLSQLATAKALFPWIATHSCSPLEEAHEEQIYQHALLLYHWQEDRSALTLLHTLCQKEHVPPLLLLRATALGANCYANLQQPQEAKEQVLRSKELAKTLQDPLWVIQCDLLQTRLALQLLPRSAWHPQHPVVEKSLETLKRIQCEKSLAQEPLHLEAAMEFAELQAALVPPKKRHAALLQGLQAAREEFSQGEDLCSQLYLDELQEDEQLQSYYRAYLLLYDARIAEQKALLAKEEQKEELCHQQLTLAQSLFTQLLQGDSSSNPYLSYRAQRGMEQLQQLAALLPLHSNGEEPWANTP